MHFKNKKWRKKMKNLFVLFFAVLFSFVLGCGKTPEKEVKKEEKKEVKKEFVSGFYCLIDGEEFSLDDVASYIEKKKDSFTIEARIESPDGKYDYIQFEVNEPLKAGEYVLNPDKKPGHAQFRTNKFKAKKIADDVDMFWSDSGKLIISKVDENGAEGSFNLVFDGYAGDAAKKLNVTEGKIKLKFKK